MSALPPDCFFNSPCKPRLRRRAAIWHCHGNGFTGLGYTPAGAYQDWVQTQMHLLPA